MMIILQGRPLGAAINEIIVKNVVKLFFNVELS